MKTASTLDSQKTMEQYLALKQRKTPVLVSEVPKELDNFIMERNKRQTQKIQLSLWAGAVTLGALITEACVLNAKRKLAKGSKELAEKVESIRKMHLAVPIMFGIGTLFAYFETQLKKKEGLISKEQIYKSQGINVKYDQTSAKVKISTGECIAMAVGAGIVIAKSLSKKKLPIPTFEMNFFENSKVLSTACDAIANGAGLAGIYSIGKMLLGNKNS